MALAVIDGLCMEKTLISVKEFPVREVGRRQKDKRKEMCVLWQFSFT